MNRFSLLFHCAAPLFFTFLIDLFFDADSKSEARFFSIIFSFSDI